MLQAVLTNKLYTQKDIEISYLQKLNSSADKVVSNHRFGTKNNINRLLFLKIKNLLPIIYDNSLLGRNIDLKNDLMDVILN